MLARLSLAKGCEQKKWAPSRQNQLTCSSSLAFSLSRVQLHSRWRLGPFHLALPRGQHRAVLIHAGDVAWRGEAEGHFHCLSLSYNLRIFTDVRDHTPLGTESATNESSVVTDRTEGSHTVSHRVHVLRSWQSWGREQVGRRFRARRVRPGLATAFLPSQFLFWFLQPRPKPDSSGFQQLQTSLHNFLIYWMYQITSAAYNESFNTNI